LEYLAIVVTGSETGTFNQAGYTDHASGKAGLQYGLARGVESDVVHLNSRARIHAIAPGQVNTPLIKRRLDDPKEMWTEARLQSHCKRYSSNGTSLDQMAVLTSH
jgi:hypothetical protein